MTSPRDEAADETLRQNPYLQAYRRALAEEAERWRHVPDWDFRFASPSVWQRREELIRVYGYAVPDDAALDVVASHSPILEVGAGGGYWAALLRLRGARVVAIDKYPPLRAPGERGPGAWTAVLPGDERAVEQYPGHTLLLCWPPHGDPMAASALKLYRGETVVYVGEGPGEACADDEFFALLGRDFEQVRSHAIPRWPGIRDSLSVWRRRSC